MRDKANSNYKKMLVNFGYIEDENKNELELEKGKKIGRLNF